VSQQDKTSLSPMLSVRNGKNAIEYYQAAFGANEMFRIEAPDGAVVARLSIDGAEFWLADESPENSNFSPELLGGSSARMVLTVSEPDVVYQ
jgi:PhnB protein